MTTPPPVDLRFGHSAGTHSYTSALGDALSQNTVPSTHHYVTTRQAAAWMRVQEKNAPPTLPAFYKNSHPWLLDHLPKAQPLCLISHGCGSGWKEADLIAFLQEKNIPTNILCADVSADLVATAIRAIKKISAASEIRGYVGDIKTDQQHISDYAPTGHRIHLFFGILPNCKVETFRALLDNAVRPGELALFSANLLDASAPDIPEEIRTVRQQYDNAAMREWLRLLPADWGWQLYTGDLIFTQTPAEPNPDNSASVTFQYIATVPDFPLMLPAGVQAPLPGSLLRLFFTERHWSNRLNEILCDKNWMTIGIKLCFNCREALVLALKKSFGDQVVFTKE